MERLRSSRYSVAGCVLWCGVEWSVCGCVWVGGCEGGSSFMPKRSRKKTRSNGELGWQGVL